MSTYTIVDDDLNLLLQLFDALGFRCDLVERQPNRHPRGMPDAAQEQQLRSILSDYAEFIIPVFWSRSEFVGTVASGVTSSQELLSVGHSEVVKAGLLEGQSAPMPAWANMPSFVPYEEWAYARNSVSCCSTQSSTTGLRRLGFLVVGRQKLSVVGLYSDFQPSIERDDLWGISPSQQRDPHWQYTVLSRKLPPDGESLHIVAEKELAYHEIETVQPIELVRFDGLAALLKVVSDFQIDGANRQFNKWQEKIVEWLWTLPAPIRSVAKLPKYLLPGTDWGMGADANTQIENLVIANFQNVCSEITHGVNVASGTGVDEEGFHNQYLFTSALGLAIESAIDGTKVFVESPFAEIDAAWELIQHQVQTASSNSGGPAIAAQPIGGTIDLAGELSQLASLHQSGVLSDDEFVAAKAAVIARLNH